MALPVIPIALKAAASLIARRGAQEAIKKYGRPTVKKAQEAIAKRQKAIDAKLLGKRPQPTKGSKARSAETNKVKTREKRLKEERDELDNLLDLDNPPIDEVPLRFDLYGGGMLSDDRQTYALGSIVKKFIKQAEKNKAKAKKKEDPRQAMDDSTDMADRGKIDMEDAIRLLDDGEEVGKVQDFLVASGYTKKDAKNLINVYRMDIDIAKPNMTNEEILEEIDRLGLKEGGPGIEALRKVAPEVVERMGYEEGGSMDDQMMMVMSMKPMESDDVMEDNYTNFIMEEALSEEEEDMLTSKLEQDEELAMLFDKVIDVAQEFAGSGPVEGPGSGVSDSIPARLSDGEFVFTAKATEEIGADELMRMMKDAEAKADERQGMAHGGEHKEETMTKQTNEPDVQEIRVVKETVDSTGRMMEDEDEISKDIKSQMMLDPNQRHVRS